MNIFAHLKSKPEMLSANDLPETQIREDGVYIKVLPRDMKKPQAI